MWGARREDAVGRGSWFESTWLARGDRRGGWFAGARRVQSRARRERGAVDWIRSVGNARDQGGQRASVLDSLLNGLVLIDVSDSRGRGAASVIRWRAKGWM